MADKSLADRLAAALGFDDHQRQEFADLLTRWEAELRPFDQALDRSMNLSAADYATHVGLCPDCLKTRRPHDPRSFAACYPVCYGHCHCTSGGDSEQNALEGPESGV